MRHGANFSQVNRIKALYSEGATAKEISARTGIALSCVESFAPAKPKGKKTPKAED